MLATIENVFAKYQEPTKGCLFALHTLVLKYDNEFSEGFKYGMPLISYKEKPFCYLWVDKKIQYPYLLIVKGNLIEHSDLEKGDRKKMKIFVVNPFKDIPIEKIYTILDSALKLY